MCTSHQSDQAGIHGSDLCGATREVTPGDTRQVEGSSAHLKENRLKPCGAGLLHPQPELALLHLLDPLVPPSLLCSSLVSLMGQRLQEQQEFIKT